MDLVGYRIEPDLLPDEVVQAAVELHRALMDHTDYSGVQVTFHDLDDYSDTTATFDVQVEQLP